MVRKTKEKMTDCLNAEYEEFCAKVYKQIPCRVGSVCGSSMEWGSLCQLFEVRDELIRHKTVSINSCGFCMYPCIRPDDIAHIELKKAEQINVGDVVVFRRKNRLFGHRAVEKGVRGDLAYIVTRADAAGSGNDGPSFDRDILGVISCVERRGRLLSVRQKKHEVIQRIRRDFGSAFYRFKVLPFFKVRRIFENIQRIEIYRKLARSITVISESRVKLSILVPLSVKTADRFSKEITPSEFICLSRDLDKNSIFRWKLVLSIDASPACSLVFMHQPATCPFYGWWLSEARIRLRYRATRIEEILFNAAKERLKDSGIEQVYAGMYNDTYLQRVLAKKLGVKEFKRGGGIAYNETRSF